MERLDRRGLLASLVAALGGVLAFWRSDAEAGQRRHRLGQARQARRVLQVEVIEGIRGHDLPGERGLAALPRADESDHAAALERTADLREGLRAFNHAGSIP